MHKRNPFNNNPPDFRQLARLYPDFEKHCNLTDEKCDIDFKNAEALKALACVLLKHSFSIYYYTHIVFSSKIILVCLTIA